MTEDEAKQLLREIAKNRTMRFTKHCRDRMRERHVTTDDMLQVLLWGEVAKLQFVPEQGNWKCEIAGKDIEGDRLVVSVAVLEEDFALLCITVMG